MDNAREDLGRSPIERTLENALAMKPLDIAEPPTGVKIDVTAVLGDDT